MTISKRMIKLSRLLDKDYSKFLDALPKNLNYKLKKSKCSHPFFAHISKSFNKKTKIKKYPEIKQVHIYIDSCRLCGQKFHKNSIYKDKNHFSILTKNYNYITKTRF